MIYGIGIDLVEVPRVQSLLECWGERFIIRCFSQREILYCQPKKNVAAHYAAHFAVKEAFLKCLGTGLRGGISMRDITIVHAEGGKPELQVTGRALAIMKEQGIASARVSISHTKEYATAIVTLEM